MRGYMFRNRWFALLFVGLILAAVTRIVGTGKGDGAIDDATRQIVVQQNRAERMTSETVPGVVSEDVQIEFTPDEELIDPATGEDPTPVDAFATPGEPAAEPETQVIIVSDETAAPAQPLDL